MGLDHTVNASRSTVTLGTSRVARAAMVKHATTSLISGSCCARLVMAHATWSFHREQKVCTHCTDMINVARRSVRAARFVCTCTLKDNTHCAHRHKATLLRLRLTCRIFQVLRNLIICLRSLCPYMSAASVPQCRSRRVLPSSHKVGSAADEKS
jgi:hypothetical protein